MVSPGGGLAYQRIGEPDFSIQYVGREDYPFLEALSAQLGALLGNFNHFIGNASSFYGLLIIKRSFFNIEIDGQFKFFELFDQGPVFCLFSCYLSTVFATVPEVVINSDARCPGIAGAVIYPAVVVLIAGKSVQGR